MASPVHLQSAQTVLRAPHTLLCKECVPAAAAGMLWCACSQTHLVEGALVTTVVLVSVAGDVAGWATETGEACTRAINAVAVL